MSRPALRLARPEDVPAIEKLLTAEWLPPFAIQEFLETFWVLEQDGQVVGSAGLEVYGQAGVLRSVVVGPSLRGKRQGRRLAEAALAEAQRQLVQRVYLFTMHAAPFFGRLGFRACAMDDFDPAARESWQYKALSERPDVAKALTPMRLEVE